MINIVAGNMFKAGIDALANAIQNNQDSLQCL